MSLAGVPGSPEHLRARQLPHSWSETPRQAVLRLRSIGPWSQGQTLVPHPYDEQVNLATRQLPRSRTLALAHSYTPGPVPADMQGCTSFSGRSRAPGATSSGSGWERPVPKPALAI